MRRFVGSLAATCQQGEARRRRYNFGWAPPERADEERTVSSQAAVAFGGVLASVVSVPS